MKNVMKVVLFLVLSIVSPLVSFSGVPQSEKDKVILKDGDMCPDFELFDVKGKKVTLKDLKGYYVYFDFWATW